MAATTTTISFSLFFYCHFINLEEKNQLHFRDYFYITICDSNFSRQMHSIFVNLLLLKNKRKHVKSFHMTKLYKMTWWLSVDVAAAATTTSNLGFYLISLSSLVRSAFCVVFLKKNPNSKMKSDWKWKRRPLNFWSSILKLTTNIWTDKKELNCKTRSHFNFENIILKLTHQIVIKSSTI